jgi:hypothetical protein
MEEDFSNLVKLQGGDIEFVVEHHDLNDPVADVFTARARFTVPILNLLDSNANDAFIGGWKQTVIYPKLSQAILSALKSTPHGLNKIPDPADTTQSGNLADLAVKTLDMVVDTMDLGNEDYLEFSMVVQTNHHFGPPILLKILHAVKAKGTSARLNVHLKGAALGTLCGFLPSFCGSAQKVTAAIITSTSVPVHSDNNATSLPVKSTTSVPYCTPDGTNPVHTLVGRPFATTSQPIMEFGFNLAAMLHTLANHQHIDGAETVELDRLLQHRALSLMNVYPSTQTEVYTIPPNDQLVVEDFYRCCHVHFKRSAVRIRRNAAVVPTDKEMQFYDLTIRLLVNQPIRDFQAIVKQLKKEYPRTIKWINWYLQPGRATTIFPALSTTDKSWFDDNTNAQESLGRDIQLQFLNRHLNVRGKSYQLIAVVWHSGMHFACTFFVHNGCVFYDGMKTPKCKWVKRDFRPSEKYICNGAWYIETKQETVKQENMDDSSSTSSSESTIPEPRPKKKIQTIKEKSVPQNFEGKKRAYYPVGLSIHRVSSHGKQPVCTSCQQAIARGQLRVVNQIITNERLGYKTACSIHHDIKCLTIAVGEAEATRILAK